MKPSYRIQEIKSEVVKEDPIGALMGFGTNNADAVAVMRFLDEEWEKNQGEGTLTSEHNCGHGTFLHCGKCLREVAEKEENYVISNPINTDLIKIEEKCKNCQQIKNGSIVRVEKDGRSCSYCGRDVTGGVKVDDVISRSQVLQLIEEMKEEYTSWAGSDILTFNQALSDLSERIKTLCMSDIYQIESGIWEDGYDVPEYASNEKHWKNGWHYTRTGKGIKLSSMGYSHLVNTIDYFKDKYDVSPLREELKKRNNDQHYGNQH